MNRWQVSLKRLLIAVTLLSAAGLAWNQALVARSTRHALFLVAIPLLFFTALGSLFRTTPQWFFVGVGFALLAALFETHDGLVYFVCGIPLVGAALGFFFDRIFIGFIIGSGIVVLFLLLAPGI
ncbi:MAG: hypothetical protein K2Y37_22205 [Pirellulales bacterium]|nr:hypothetical protein [Pirellulales bacterium]